ncbi:MAG: MOSC N-terminal beta barrel domain-containing protein [Candidatus Caldarchaeum sp.]|nr:MOSC N-terminal beta barrel domain-containing protein [Candidatus Caldarchaeum sp.]
MGVVERVIRYPVKSLAGEELETGFVGFDGLVGDRVYAVVDVETGYALSAKKEARLLEVSVKLVDQTIELTFPDGTIYRREDECNDALTRFLGRRVKLTKNSGQPLRYTGLEIDFEQNMRLYEKTGETRETRFHDSMPVHLLNLHSLPDYGLSGADFPRFRPNIVFSSDLSDEELVGRYVLLGEAVLKVVKPTKRCIVVTHQQQGLPKNLQILKNLRLIHGGKMGTYAVVVRPGTVAKHSPVEVYEDAP